MLFKLKKPHTHKKTNKQKKQTKQNKKNDRKQITTKHINAPVETSRGSSVEMETAWILTTGKDAIKYAAF